MTRRKDEKSQPEGIQKPSGYPPKFADALRKSRFGDLPGPHNIRKIPEKRIRELIEGLDGGPVTSEICKKELRKIGAPAIPALMKALGNEEDAGGFAARLISEIGVDDTQFGILVGYLGNKGMDKATRTSAAYSLSKMKDRETMGILTENLADEEIGKEIAAYLAWEFGVKAFPQIAQAYQKGIIDKDCLKEFTGYLERDLEERDTQEHLGNIHELLICGKTDLERKWAAHALITLREEPVPAVEKAHLGDSYDLLSWCLGRLGLDAQQQMGIIDIINSLRGYKKPE